MHFKLFAPLFEKVDSTTQTFVTDISSRVIAEITPFIVSGITVTLLTYSILIMRGTIDMPITDFIGRVIRIGVITSIALAGGFYQSNIAAIITTLPDSLAYALIPDPTTGESAAHLIDHAASNGFDRAGEAFENGGFFSTEGLTFVVFGFMITMVTVAMTSIGGTFIMLSKVALTLLAGLGPLFISALLFQPTYRFFELWIAQVVNYTLTIVLFSILVGFMMDIYGNFMDEMHLDGIQNIYYGLGGASIISVVTILVMLQLPSIASSLAGGVSLGYLWELRTLRNSVTATGRTLKKFSEGAISLGKGMYNTGKKTATIVRSLSLFKK